MCDKFEIHLILHAVFYEDFPTVQCSRPDTPSLCYDWSDTPSHDQVWTEQSVAGGQSGLGQEAKQPPLTNWPSHE